MNKEKLTNLKSKIKKHRSEIIATATTVAFITYIALDRKNYVRLPKDEYSVLELPHSSVQLMMEEDVHPYYDIFGHRIHVHYNEDMK